MDLVIALVLMVTATGFYFYGKHLAPGGELPIDKSNQVEHLRSIKKVARAVLSGSISFQCLWAAGYLINQHVGESVFGKYVLIWVMIVAILLQSITIILLLGAYTKERQVQAAS